MIGILTEKPSACRNFAKALGGNSGTFNGEQYVLCHARGHLVEFDMPENQVQPALRAQYHDWKIENLPWNESDFKWKKVKSKDAAPVLSTIESTLKNCSEVVIATDVDPSGEGGMIACEIFEHLNIRNKKFSRMYFTDESVKEIQKAFVNRKPISSFSTYDEYLKAEYRSKFDYLTMQFTRISTKCGDGHSVLRQGRLKSAMVLLVGDALKALAEYKKIPYYQNRFKDENGVVYSDVNEPQYKTKEEVPKKYEPSNVIVDSKEHKYKAPPKLLDLAALSSILSGKGVKAKEVLAVYQKMYEAQIVSYPRTEDKTITPEQFHDLLPKVDDIARVVGVDTSLLTHRTVRKTHVKAQGAHGANRPGPNVPKSLNDLTQYGRCAPMIYEILAKNYLAMLGEDYEYEAQKGHLEKYPSFKGTASVPLKLGYKQIFDTEANTKAQDDEDNDENVKGLGTLAKPFIHEGFPKKPPTPTMKWLMKQLEKRDVGTGATRTSTYADVTNEKTKYPLLIEKKGKLSMSQYGEMSYGLLPNTNIGSLDLTEKVWKDMDRVAKGEASCIDLLSQVRQMVVEDIETMKKNAVTMRKENPKMASGSEQKEKFTGTWNGKEVKVNREWGGHRFTDDECERLLNGEEIEINGLKSKSGSEYGVVGKLADLEYNGHPFVGFNRLRFAGESESGIPGSWCKHKFTDDEMALLEQGITISCDDFVSKKGSTFSAKVHFDKATKKLVPEFG